DTGILRMLVANGKGYGPSPAALTNRPTAPQFRTLSAAILHAFAIQVARLYIARRRAPRVVLLGALGHVLSESRTAKEANLPSVCPAVNGYGGRGSAFSLARSSWRRPCSKALHLERLVAAGGGGCAVRCRRHSKPQRWSCFAGASRY